MCNRIETSQSYDSTVFSEDANTKKEKSENSSLLCGYNDKISSRLIHLLVLIVTGLVNLLFPHFFRIFFVCNATLLSFSLLLIGIFLLRSYKSIETADSY